MTKRFFALFSNLSHHTVSLILLGILLFLRIPYLAIVAALFDPPPTWLYISFAIATYLVTAVLIWWERERLQTFWFDLVSAVVFLCQNFMFIAGIGLFTAMFRCKARFPRPSGALVRWMLIGAFFAVLSQIATSYAGLYPPQERGMSQATLVFLFSAVPVQMLNAAVWEEPLFRGFLWGHLRLAGWRNVWIWLFQAALFTLSHVYYLRTEPVLPWLVRMIIPSLLLGLIAWQARSIAASMVTHGFLNATGDLLMHMGTQAEAFRVAWLTAGLLAAGLGVVVLLEIVWARRKTPPLGAS